MRTARRLGLLIGLGVIAALGVLSFRTLLTWMAGTEPDAPATSLVRDRPTAPTRTPAQGEAPSEPAESESAREIDHTPETLGEPQRLDGIADTAPSRPVSLDRSGADSPSELGPASEPSTTETERPLGWCFFTTLDHEAVSDSDEIWNGSRSVVIGEAGPVSRSAFQAILRSTTYHVNALWQAVDATPYRNARVEFGVHVKSRGAVFVFLHATTKREVLTNNQLRVASSNNRYVASLGDDWTELAVVGDIAADAELLYFGVAQNGRAPLWVDDTQVMKVGADAPVTVNPSQNAPLFLYVSSSASLAEPTNLDFEITTEDPKNDAPSVAETPC